ncbi:hypothetical protein FK268_23685, partial [Tsukamurella sputi]
YAGQPYPPQQPPKKRKKWPWVLLGIFILIVALFGGCMAVVGKAVDEVDKESKSVVDVTYKVTGPSTGALITYTFNDNITQDNDVALPWEKKTQVTGFAKTVSLSATNGMNDTGKITCQVIVDGKVIIENTASGTGASASCSGSVDKK